MYSITLDEDAVFDDWQPYARHLLNHRIPPEQVIWQSAPTGDLFGANTARCLGKADLSAETGTPTSPVRVNRHFFQLAQYAACHRDSRRFDLLYRILWRLAFENRLLLADATDPMIHQANQWAKAVGRDRHKMKAFVRFRKVTVKDVCAGQTEITQDAKEHYIAWFEPDHHIVKLTADFFCGRFSNMDWTIMTPGLCAHWIDRVLTYSPGGHWKNAPPADELETYWRTYYASIFNPARLKIKAMCAEMPKKYWRNLPEAGLIRPLIEQSELARQRMLEQPPTEPALPESSRFQREQWLLIKSNARDSTS
ncbi:MAG: TIGR03915 family putative DNA repair protein [Ketobacteraceae bacterium]|nr:TIGR03915 family putative DNA repair protein [Ketobacteraceae bacterium]